MTRSVHHRGRSHEAAGFTLLELLASIAIFGVLAAMLFQMVSGGLSVWRMGEGQREDLEKSTAILDEVVADLRMLRADSPAGTAVPDIRALADFAAMDFDADGIEESLVQRVRWVRSLPEERWDPRLRLAGQVPGGEETSDDVGLAEQFARAPGGLAEVAYATVRAPSADGDPALLTLVRLFRTPIGGAGSLFAEKSVLDDPRELLRNGVALADNVLHFGVEFWSRDTVSWNDDPGSLTSPLRTWDSTRGILLDRDGANRFPLAKDVTSLADPGDDVFARRARLTLAIQRDVDEAEIIRVTEPVTATGQALKVSSARPFEGRLPDHPFVKVGGEWMRWTEVRDGELKVVRAARGTVAVPHAAGTRVHLGKTFQRVVEIPVFRENWNDA